METMVSQENHGVSMLFPWNPHAFGPVLGHDEALQRGVASQAKDGQKEAAHEVAKDDVKDGGNDRTLGSEVESGPWKSLVLGLAWCLP